MSLSTPPLIEKAQVACYRFPTEQPESDGTFEWSATTLVLVTLRSNNNIVGIGYTYADIATAKTIEEHLLPVIRDGDATAIALHHANMRAALRNIGAVGSGAMAISAVDNALWDLKAKLFGIALVDLLGAVRIDIPVYGSGGFTSYSQAQLREQLSAWQKKDFAFVKMKIGRDAKADIERVRIARDAIGDICELFVDANGAYTRKQALAQAQAFAQFNVAWFEEPVIATDFDGLRLLRDRAPPGMAISGGEYGYELDYFRRALTAQIHDVMQADATRCGGISGFLSVAALCAAHSTPLSSHCAPALHLHIACAAKPVCHVEYFHDHVRLEQRLFDGVQIPCAGRLKPDRARAGFGLEFKAADAQEFLV
jgi:L-alanine-DL-glutamate epimerase-like enolase superfamily enzyme